MTFGFLVIFQTSVLLQTGNLHNYPRLGFFLRTLWSSLFQMWSEIEEKGCHNGFFKIIDKYQKWSL